ncbi:MAG: HAMP domain-containing histidine kinase, partial [Bacteroidales bacterium]|nr:HAMP domain-containing histidine kinase [Bacteroidales bacterium]
KEEIEAQAQKLESSLDNIKSLTKFKDELTQMLVHDLKNPISAIINLPSSIPQREQKEITKYSAHTMLNLVMNILDVRKYEDAKLRIVKTEQNVIALWENAIRQLAYLAEQKNITINYNKNIEIITIVDKELIERVLINVLSNALKYTNLNGEINLYAEEIKKSTVKITIEDNGLGISKKDVASIFTKYGQSGEKINYSTGLGLTFCKIAIEEHGGEIGIESDEGKGTSLWFKLPETELIVKKPEKESIHEKIIISKPKGLKKFLPLFKEIEVYQISDQKKLLLAIKNEGLENEQWVKLLENAITTCNNEQYVELLKKLDDTDII